MTVKTLIKEIILASKKKNIKIVVTKSTPGDSKIFHTNNRKLLKLYPGTKFTTIKEGLKKYFDWINSLPVVKNLENYHPFKKVKFY